MMGRDWNDLAVKAPAGLTLDDLERQAKTVFAAPVDRFPIMRFEDVQLSTSRRYLIKNVIPRHGLCVAWGPPKCGKSFWIFDLTMHVALGWEYGGRRVEQGPVCYVACEGAEGFKARIEAFRQTHLQDYCEAIPFYLVPARTNLVSDKSGLIDAITGYLGPLKPAAVVIDTLNRSLQGSESSDGDMTAYIRAADEIGQTLNCAVVIVHHCGIDGSRPRGHTALTGAVDSQIAVKRIGDGVVSATVEHLKDGPEGEEILFRLETVTVGTDDDGDAITSCIVAPLEDSISVKATRAKVTGASLRALELLHTALADAGELPPASNHIPPDTKAIRLTLWRNYCDKGQVAGSDNPDSKQKAFKRAADKLQNADFIGVWSDWVWTTDKARRDRT